MEVGKNNYIVNYSRQLLKECLALKEKMDVRVLEVLLTSGRIENYFNHPKKAIPYLKKCLARAIELDRPINVNKAMLFLGESYYKLRQYATSIEYLKKSEPYFEKNKDEKYLPELANYLAKNYLHNNNTSQYKKQYFKKILQRVARS